MSFQQEIYGEIQDKYPDNLASLEKSLSYKVQKIRAAQECINFSAAAETMKTYEDETDKYVFIAPETPKDLIEEGQMQSNCVGGYVKRIADGECMVFFMRLKSSPKKSLVTIEIQDGTLLRQMILRTQYS